MLTWSVPLCFRLVKGGTVSRWRDILFAIGRPLSPIYGFAMTIRAYLYRRGILPSTRLRVPVVSVGNLTMGGTGKTPLVMCVVQHLLEHGHRPAVVSRGYGGKARGRVNVVSDGSGARMSPVLAGDEPWLLADSMPSVPVLTGSRRAVVASYALEVTDADIIVMDDGFQHLALQRDLDIVLFNIRSSLDAARVFPGGELREPFDALQRADAIVLTGVDKRTEEKAFTFKRFLRERAHQAPVFFGEYLPVCLLSSDREDVFPLEKAKRMKLCGFCGIGNPASFREILGKEGYGILGFRAFRDHHPYSAEDVKSLTAWARKLGAHGLITTQKDFVKLKPYFGDFPILALKVELFMEENFDHFLTHKLSSIF